MDRKQAFCIFLSLVVTLPIVLWILALLGQQHNLFLLFLFSFGNGLIFPLMFRLFMNKWEIFWEKRRNSHESAQQ